MKKIKTFDTFNEGVSKLSTYLTNILKKGGKIASDTWEATTTEDRVIHLLSFI